MGLKYLIRELEDINPSYMEVDDYKRWVEKDEQTEDLAELIVSMGRDFGYLIEGLKEMEDEEEDADEV